jgi:hypothetical protein
MMEEAAVEIDRQRKVISAMIEDCQYLKDKQIEAADEIERLRKYEQLVNFIATDYVELSHDKVQNEYLLIIKKCRELVKEDMVKIFDEYLEGLKDVKDIF